MPSVASRALQVTDRTHKTRTAHCPKCSQAVSCAEAEATFDSHGFESYRLNCIVCEAQLNGIVDPLDDEFLLSVSYEV